MPQIHLIQLKVSEIEILQVSLENLGYTETVTSINEGREKLLEKSGLMLENDFHIYSCGFLIS